MATGAALDQAVMQPMMLGNTLIENQAVRDYGKPDQPLTEGMGNAFAGGLAFAPFGAAGAALRPRAGTAPAPVEFNRPKTAAAPPTEPGAPPPPAAPIAPGSREAPPPVSEDQLAAMHGAGREDGDIGRAKDGLPFASRIAAISAL